MTLDLPTEHGDAHAHGAAHVASIVNVSLRLRERAAESPDRCAVRAPGGEQVTFAGLERRVDAIAHGLTGLGLARGDRTCVFVRPGVDLIAVTHALLRIGAPPVLIDPGMGRKNLLSCVERMGPRALIGVPRAHVARLLFPRAFRTCELHVSVGTRGPGGLFGRSLESLVAAAADRGPFPCAPTGAEDVAAILFTSGSTGPPKGVLYDHGNFEAQLATLRELYALAPGEVDLACFPLFALFDNALGMTSVFPELDPSRPGACDPEKIHDAIESSGATFAFGSPAIWHRVVPWVRDRGLRFSTLRRVTIAGAPVPPALVAGLRALLPSGGEVHTPYGATEALPVSSAAGADIVALRDEIEGGGGSYVGRSAPGIEVRAIRIDDEPIERWSEGLEVPAGELGELCVRGAVVTREYASQPGPTRAAKIHDAGTLWHRMGDVGRVDAEGRIWVAGRKSHRIETRAGLRLPVPAENAFCTVDGVRRAALVGVGPRGSERPVLVVQPESGATPRELEPLLRAVAGRVPACAGVNEILFRRELPVDVRHNAKIHRLELKRWAERRLGS